MPPSWSAEVQPFIYATLDWAMGKWWAIEQPNSAAQEGDPFPPTTGKRKTGTPNSQEVKEMSDRQEAVLKNLDSEIESMQEVVQEFVTKVTEAAAAGGGIGHILSWQAENVIWHEHKALKLKGARITVAEHWDDPDARNWLASEIKNIREDAMRPRNWVSRSTSPMSNLKEHNQFAARVDTVPTLRYIIAEMSKDRDEEWENQDD